MGMRSGIDCVIVFYWDRCRSRIIGEQRAAVLRTAMSGTGFFGEMHAISPDGAATASVASRAVNAVSRLHGRFVARTPSRVASIVLALLANAQPGIAAEPDAGTVRPEPGIRHVITGSIKADPGYAGKTYEAKDRATLIAMVRISDHARESQFYGDVPATLSDFPIATGSPEQEIWADSTCHQRRGVPKFAVVAIDGFIAAGQGRISVSARPRHIGLHVPPDEISAGRRLVDGVDATGAFTILRAETSQSHVAVDLTLRTLNCDITAGK